MARARRSRRGRRGTPTRDAQRRAKGVRDIVNHGTALQIELLGAAIKVWSTMFETMAAYVKTSSEEIVGLTSGGDANAVLDTVVKSAREKLDSLTSLPEDVARGFARKVRARAKA